MKKKKNRKIKIILFLLVFVIVPEISFAQDVGLRSGFGISNAIMGEEAFKNFANNLLAFSVSGSKYLPLNDRHFFNIELQLMSKGYRFGINNYFDEDFVSARMRMNSTSLNVIMVWNSFEDRIVKEKIKRRKIDKSKKVYLLSGIYSNINLISNWKYIDNITANQDLRFPIKSFDVGLILGIKVGRQISKKRSLYFDFRYYHGLRNIYDHPFNIIKMRSIEVGVEYQFIKKKKRKRKKKKSH